MQLLFIGASEIPPLPTLVSDMAQHPFYRKLDSGPQEIRLLTILSDADGDPVRCTLRTVLLDSDLRFNAISYCWGFSNIATPIKVDNCVTQVAFNLEQGLRRLKRSCGPREIWVDAICINHDDISEEDHQVPLMRDIYLLHSGPSTRLARGERRVY